MGGFDRLVPPFAQSLCPVTPVTQTMSNGLGGLNKSPNGVVIGVVQLQLPVVSTPEELRKQTDRIVEMVGKARRNLGTMDLVVFPEYSLHGLSMATDDAIMCSLDGPEVAKFKAACKEHKIWGCFSIMELNPGGNPYNTGIIIDDTGALKLYYRKLHPWSAPIAATQTPVSLPACPSRVRPMSAQSRSSRGSRATSASPSSRAPRAASSR